MVETADVATRDRTHLDRRLLALTLVPMAAAGLMLLAMHLAGTTGGDVPAHAYKTVLVRQGRSLAWDDYWYAGTAGLISYGPLFYLLAAVVGRVPLVIASAGLLPLLFHLYVRRAWQVQSLAPAVVLGVVLTIYLAYGQDPFLLALALTVGGLALKARGRSIWGGLLVGLAVFANPVALAVGAVFALADLLAHRAARRSFVPFALTLLPFVVIWVALTRAFGGPTFYLAETVVLLKWAAVGGLGTALATFSDDPDRRGRQLLFGLGAAMCLAAFVAPGELGNNAGRYFAVFAAPLFLMIRKVRLPRIATWAIVVAAAGLQVATPLSYLTATGDYAQTRPSFFAPALAFARSTHDAAYRIHAVALRKHWESYYFPLAGLPIVRGWFRQADAQHNAILYDDPTPARYVAWLRDLGVRDVYVPHAALDPFVVDERSLIERSRAFDVVHRDRDWTVYRLRDPMPLVVSADRTTPASAGSPSAQGAVVTAMTHDTVQLDVRRPGRYVVKVTWSPYWRLQRGDGALGRAPGDWLRLRARAPGVFVLQERPTLGAALRHAL